ncbi:hypothetical protein ACLB2K_023592 [Fragaria x ananassa]|uniref:cysteine proteinase inhibitor 5-like n=1 Tax=Fragaria vesca subsp. vesca TaxID=101020 RepID=UPI0005CA1CBA|nr:PREDICTED: cysteine proteinase inhibitor 5-like [Fragaria vesca subsp. vesca]
MHNPLYLLVLFALLLIGGNTQPINLDGPDTGGYQRIPNPATDPDVKEIVEFAISEINFQSLKNLVLTGIVRAELQMVEGLNYHLVIEVRGPERHNTTEEYEFTVFTRYWDKIQVLKKWRLCLYGC